MILSGVEGARLEEPHEERGNYSGMGNDSKSLDERRYRWIVGLMQQNINPGLNRNFPQ